MTLHLELVAPGVENSATAIYVLVVHGTCGQHVESSVVLGLFTIALELEIAHAHVKHAHFFLVSLGVASRQLLEAFELRL